MLQAGRTPEPVGPADAHAIAVAAEKDADAAVAVPWILRRRLLHPLDRGRILAVLRLR